MNSNGISEWILEAGRSRYITPQLPYWTWIAIGIVIGMLIGSPAHAECLTLHEARQAWPSTYLSWHGDHCWFAKGHRHHVEAKRMPLPLARPGTAPAQEWIYAERWWVS